MAALGQYYIDAQDLPSATAVYDDFDMTISATDGWYSDTNIVRRQVSGLLQPSQPCSCP